MLDTSFPCECGHDMADHPKVGRFAYLANTVHGDYNICNGCFRASRVNGVKQLYVVECMTYRRDNLRYLEEKATQKETKELLFG